MYDKYGKGEDFMATLRKNITIKEEDFEKISDFAYRNRVSVSELLRKAAIFYINVQESMDLSEYLKKNCDFVSEEEQKDLDNWIKELKNNSDSDYDSDEGQEITLEDIIQGKL